MELSKLFIAGRFDNKRVLYRENSKMYKYAQKADLQLSKQ